MELANSDHKRALNMLQNAKTLFSHHQFLHDQLHPIDIAIEKLGDIQ
jgi:hypothetical protein